MFLREKLKAGIKLKIVFVTFDNEYLNKSNTYFFAYAWLKCELREILINLIQEFHLKIKDDLIFFDYDLVEHEELDDNTLIVTVDDVSYSGDQMVENLDELLRVYNEKIMGIHLILPYVSKHSIKNLMQVFGSLLKIEYVERIPSLSDIQKNINRLIGENHEKRKLLRKVIILFFDRDEAEEEVHVLDKSMAIFQHKLADELSVYSSYLKELIRECDDMTCPCPIPFYKITSSKLR